jgi:capsular polysaccharide biosynthesis protein
VLDSCGNFDKNSGLTRNWGTIVSSPDCSDIKALQSIDEEAIFAGYLFAGHYGHFLLESCARLWFAAQHPELPIVWATKDQYSAFNKEVYEILGVNNEPVFIENPTVFRELHVPEPGYQIQNFASPEHMKFLAAWPPKSSRKSDYVWLSRSNLPLDRGGIVEERHVEQVLREMGWVILHPEKHSVSDQLDFLAGARHIAGFMGSAFHSLVLLKENPERVTIFSRGSPNNNYETIALARGFCQDIVDLPLDRVSGQGVHTRWSLGNPERVISLLSDCIIAY